MSKDSQKQHPRSMAPKYPGITATAKALNVSRNHLFLVLSGKRQSKRLMASYLRLTKAAA